MKGTTPPIFGVLNAPAMTVCRHLVLLTPADCPGRQKMQFFVVVTPFHAFFAAYIKKW